jgi:hypothetical protein
MATEAIMVTTMYKGCEQIVHLSNDPHPMKCVRIYVYVLYARRHLSQPRLFVCMFIFLNKIATGMRSCVLVIAHVCLRL